MTDKDSVEPRKRPRGTCSICGHRVALCSDGTAGIHWVMSDPEEWGTSGRRKIRSICVGWGTEPDA